MNVPANVLFLCTGNSARSILGEVIANDMGAGRLKGFSAGSAPKGAVHQQTLQLLAAHGHMVAGLHSKSWNAFAESPAMDIVITVCNSAAAESCPVWPGAPVSVHWGLPDPAAAALASQPDAFAAAYGELCRRILAIEALPLEAMTAGEIKRALQELAD